MLIVDVRFVGHILAKLVQELFALLILTEAEVSKNKINVCKSAKETTEEHFGNH